MHYYRRILLQAAIQSVGKLLFRDRGRNPASAIVKIFLASVAGLKCFALPIFLLEIGKAFRLKDCKVFLNILPTALLAAFNDSLLHRQITKPLSGI